jgi:hypothetical protein
MFTDWEPVALDEPFGPSATDFYGHLEILPTGKVRPAEQRGVRELISRYAEAARAMKSQQGVLATARKSLAVAARLRRQGLARFRR